MYRNPTKRYSASEIISQFTFLLNSPNAANKPNCNTHSDATQNSLAAAERRRIDTPTHLSSYVLHKVCAVRVDPRDCASAPSLIQWRLRGGYSRFTELTSSTCRVLYRGTHPLALSGSVAVHLEFSSRARGGQRPPPRRLQQHMQDFRRVSCSVANDLASACAHL